VKLVPTLLAISLAANLALLIAYTKLTRPGEKVELASTKTARALPSQVLSPASTTVSGNTTAATVSEATGRTRSWSQIETDDFDELARRLKAAGFSSQEIRAILSARITEKYTNGSRQLPYWQSEYPNYADPKVQEKQAEQEALYRKYVFGPQHLADDPEQLRWAQRRYGALPMEKLQAIATIEADYREVMNKRSSQKQTALDDPNAARAAYELIQKEQEADIAKVLTPEEYADYELRSGPIANRLRFRLEAFQPSEEEYKTIFAIEKSFAAKTADTSLTGEARQALQEQMTNEVASALGPDRALDYQESTRNGGDRVSRLVTALGLPPRVNSQIRTMQQDYTERAKTVRADPQLPAADRTAQLSALAQEARAKLSTTLGAEGYEAYNDMKGDWIRALEAK
jgi:hypothetical protein